MTLKAFVSALAIGITLLAFIPYISSILKGTTKPHVFSWIIWGTTTFVVFLAQLDDNGGVGAWPIGVSGIITILIACLAYAKRGDISITTSDWIFFLMAMSALLLWYLLKNPLWAVVVLTIVDSIGFIPTARKVYHAPYSEPLSFIILFLIRNILVILALEHYSVTTVLFPAVIAMDCLLLIILIMLRRHKINT
jgi:hypothetical protein